MFLYDNHKYLFTQNFNPGDVVIKKATNIKNLKGNKLLRIDENKFLSYSDPNLLSGSEAMQNQFWVVDTKTKEVTPILFEQSFSQGKYSGNTYLLAVWDFITNTTEIYLSNQTNTFKLHDSKWVDYPKRLNFFNNNSGTYVANRLPLSGEVFNNNEWNITYGYIHFYMTSSKFVDNMLIEYESAYLIDLGETK